MSTYARRHAGRRFRPARQPVLGQLLLIGCLVFSGMVSASLAATHAGLGQGSMAAGDVPHAQDEAHRHGLPAEAPSVPAGADACDPDPLCMASCAGGQPAVAAGDLPAANPGVQLTGPPAAAAPLSRPPDRLLRPPIL